MGGMESPQVATNTTQVRLNLHLLLDRYAHAQMRWPRRGDKRWGKGLGQEPGKGLSPGLTFGLQSETMHRTRTGNKKEVNA